MWHFLVALMWLIMEAKVVDLPAPVGPVTSTSPLSNLHRFWQDSLRPISSIEGTRLGISRIEAQKEPRSW